MPSQAHLESSECWHRLFAPVYADEPSGQNLPSFPTSSTPLRQSYADATALDLKKEKGAVRDGHAHRVDEHTCRLERVVRSAREGIASCDPPQMRDCGCGGGCQDCYPVGWNVDGLDLLFAFLARNEASPVGILCNVMDWGKGAVMGWMGGGEKGG